ncbi:MAG TPA: hypothetical protein VHK28_05550, partial [Candidatus Limnocylindria bacterium]|nr:hypothetical protein [Candidatus Limnocylindria bacterium]
MYTPIEASVPGKVSAMRYRYGRFTTNLVFNGAIGGKCSTGTALRGRMRRSAPGTDGIVAGRRYRCGISQRSRAPMVPSSPPCITGAA